jgi:hypothetical protein
MPSHSRSKNGVASLAYVPGIPINVVQRFRLEMAGTSPAATIAKRDRHFIVGMTNSAPSFTPEGQRAVTVLVLV